MDESGHWYDKDGHLILEVPRARGGGTRPPNLRDARKYSYLPSVTTVLGVVDRPGLRVWWTEAVIETALRLPHATKGEIIEEASAYVEWAAQQGSKIHLGISEHFNGRYISIEPEVDATVREFWPWYSTSGLVVLRSERPVVSPLGYAGTVDYEGTYDGHPCFLDFKTQDFDRVQDANFYDEHALQLAGYAEAAGHPEYKRLSAILSRTTPGLVAFHDWTPENARWSKAWLALWEFWQHLKNYYPGRPVDPDQMGRYR